MQNTLPASIGIWDVVLRMLCAMAVGIVIGTEREYSNHPAGMRTHILVALGACAVMLTGQMVFAQYAAYGASPDPARLAAQVITGVGFLGAGTILREGPMVRGLTTAASLWTVACLGVAAGGGYYTISLVGMVFTFITLTFFEILQNRFIGQHSNLVCYQLETDDIGKALDAISLHSRKQNAGIRDLQTRRESDGRCRLQFRADIGGMRGKKRRQNFLSGLASSEAILCIRVAEREEEFV